MVSEEEGRRTVAHDDAGALADGVDGDLEGQVVGDEHDGFLLAGVDVRVAEQETDVVPRPVGESFRVAVQQC